ncbi:TPA: hypothetical protein I7726_14405 [Vibrio vulnificus]|uniref:methyltransferase n=1 Tax=Vibrio vulnificus TaxID=672 RepID=UPI001A2379F5|nr:methyltransferase [Vibrio vulnificus]MCA3928086.1 hypothetical protein [Vibrio vulnificus]HAS8451204.1 hypothetical protein [Vibrio vulnificus]
MELGYVNMMKAEFEPYFSSSLYIFSELLSSYFQNEPVSVRYISQKTGFSFECLDKIILLLYSRGVLESYDLYEFFISKEFKCYFSEGRFSRKGTLSFDSVLTKKIFNIMRFGEEKCRRTYDYCYNKNGPSSEHANYYVPQIHAHSLAPIHYLVTRGLFKGIKSITDIGCGSGALVEAIQIQGNLNELDIINMVDNKEICLSAKVFLEKRQVVLDKCKFYVVNFVEDSVRIKSECYFLSNVLHSLSMDNVFKLLKMTYDNTPDNGKVIIHETLRNLDAKKDCWTAAAFDLQVYISSGWGKKSYSEIRTLLLRAGFKKVEIKSKFHIYSTIEATK